jgi:small ligand-binding sensory domain FIST
VTGTRCASALSVHPVAATATGEVVGALLEALGPEPDLVVLFASRPHTGALDDVVAAVRQLLQPRCLVGSTAASIAGGAEEIEEAPALSALAVRFPPGAGAAEPVRLQTASSAEGTAVWGLPDTPPGATFVLLTDPYSFPVDPFLDGLAVERPDLVVLGGMASAAHGPGGNRLVLDGVVHDDGAVGVVLPIEVAVTAIVSQGCRPIGQPMVVTAATGNLLESLASEPALAKLLRVVDALDPDERALAARGLHLGRVVDEQQAEFGPGDFLIRNVLGAVREREAVAIGDRAEVGTTVQFQVRDAASADAELRSLLAGRAASGALLFTCNGRGTHLFGDPHHDASVLAEHAGGATAGMFCAGEIGPVGGRAWVHGFTASVLLFD